MKIIAIVKTIMLTEFLRNEKFVGFTFNRSEYFNIIRFNTLLNMNESINANKRVPRISAPK